MSLAPGSRIGPHEIVAPLGAGGMGEVYRAHDGRLGRDVAIKVLPAAFAADPDRLQRFEQEARAAGALNHPNLLTVFDTGLHDGGPYIVFELLRGATLRQLLDKGPPPLRKALDYGVQIAQGLAAAHQKGIVHRDLKPDNLFATDDGRVKILDFGLAKLRRALDEDARSAEVTASEITDAGAVVGTVGYMSPEQVQGLPADPRSDVFALGCVLYELISGRRAFKGTSAVETLHAILKQDPPELSGATPLPPALERIVRRCLEKNADERFHAARDLAFALEALSGDSRASSPGQVSVRGRPAGDRKARIAAGVAGGLAALLAAFLAGRRSAERPPAVFERLTHRQGRVGEARFGPDGHTIYYSAEWDARAPQLFMARAGSLESRPLDLPEAGLLAISSSGEMALSLRPHWSAPDDVMQGTLARVPLAGGAPREIQDDVYGADWSPDSSEMAVVKSGERHRLEFPLGMPVLENEPDEILAHPRVSPRGNLVALFESQGLPCGVVVVDHKGVRRRLTGFDYRMCSGLAWSSDGREVWFTGIDSSGTSSLRAVTLEGRARIVLAMPGRLALRDISRSGEVLLAHGITRFSIHGRVPGADEERNLSWFGNSYVKDLSADGSTLLLGDWVSAAGLYPLFLRRTDGSPAVRLGDGVGGRISPDGRWVVAFLASPHRIVLLPTGAGQPRELPVGPFSVEGVFWFPDGQRVLATGRKGGPGGTLVTWAQDLKGGPPVPLLDGYYGSLPSPDGRFVLALAGGKVPFVLCAVDGEACRAIPALGGEPLRWSADGRSLLVATYHEERSVSLARVDISTGRREPVTTLGPADPTGVFGCCWAGMSQDGRSYAYSFGRSLSDLYLVKGLR